MIPRWIVWTPAAPEIRGAKGELIPLAVDGQFFVPAGFLGHQLNRREAEQIAAGRHGAEAIVTRYAHEPPAYARIEQLRPEMRKRVNPLLDSLDEAYRHGLTDALDADGLNLAYASGFNDGRLAGIQDGRESAIRESGQLELWQDLRKAG